MNAFVFIVLIAEILNLIASTEASSSWWWRGKAKPKHWKWQSSDTDRSCHVGKCVQAYKCPKSSITNHSSDYCEYSNDGPMVCCIFNNNYGLQSATDSYSLEIPSTSSKHSKQPVPTAMHSNDFSVENQARTHSTEEHWNRNSWARPTPISSLGDILKKSREIYPSPRPHNKVTDIPIDTWKKTTENTRKYIRTTDSWNKPRTSESRIIFPTESPWIPKISQHPAFATSYSKFTQSWTTTTRSTTTKAPWRYSTASTRRISNSKPTKSWLTHPTTSKAPWGYSTVSTSKTSDSKLTKSWPTRSNTTKAHWGYSTVSTSKTSDSKSTKSWPTRSNTTKAPWGHSTVSTSKASDSKSTKSWPTRSNTTKAPWGYSTISTSKASDNKSTKSLPTRSNTTKAPRGYSSVSTSTTSDSKSTKSWPTPSTTTKTPWGYSTRSTNGIAFNPVFTTKFLSKSTNNVATKSIILTSTTAPWGYTTRSTKRTISTQSPLPISRKSTEYARITTPLVFKPFKSEERNSQGSRGSTPVSPSRDPSMNPKRTIRPNFAKSTTSKRSRTTTALPDVNTYLCGIRDVRSDTRRQKRDYSRASDTVSLDGRLPFQRIVGGEEVEPFTWPWVAALYQVTSTGGYRFLSAGSLINENFVLTASHVFTAEDLRTSSYVIMLGTHNAQDAVAEYHVSSVLRHPNYEQRYFYHDIALLRLKRRVTFNNYVMPVCLPSADAPFLRDADLQGKNVTVMGWGDDSFGGKSSRVLKRASFPVASRASCNASYIRVASNSFPKGITDDMLCAGDPNGGKDACQGDSGGPLTIIENGRYTQVGIVSFGFQCGDKEYPGVYTKVAPYLSWIAESISCMSSEDYGSDYY